MIFLISSPGGSTFGLFILLIVSVIYFIPTWIAYSKKKKNRVAILLVNVFLGWTLIGWVGALIWAVVYEHTEVNN